mmetsp:Transcript_34001/g.39988  ORF Transcript_34001/g.39988 Transcript_34001/m.39988 type:complete len:186 (+) Transcript_34001:11-568(+)
MIPKTIISILLIVTLVYPFEVKCDDSKNFTLNDSENIDPLVDNSENIPPPVVENSNTQSNQNIPSPIVGDSKTGIKAKTPKGVGSKSPGQRTLRTPLGTITYRLNKGGKNGRFSKWQPQNLTPRSQIKDIEKNRRKDLDRRKSIEDKLLSKKKNTELQKRKRESSKMEMTPDEDEERRKQRAKQQ